MKRDSREDRVAARDSDAGRNCGCRKGPGVNVEGEDVGHLLGTRRRAWGAPATVSCRNDAFVGGQDVVDHVVDAEVVR